MNKIKLLAFDIDGTLIPRGYTGLPTNTKETLLTMQHNGYKILLSTGRSSFFIQKDLLNTLHSDYYVTANGTIVTDSNFNTLIKHPLDETIFYQLIELAKQYNIAIAFKFEKAIAIYHNYKDYVATYTNGVEHPDILIDNTKENNYHLTHGYPCDAFLIGDNDILRHIASLVSSLEWVVAYDRAMEAYNKGVSKASGIEYVMNQLDLSWENVMAFGDSENDIEMLSKAGIGVAMGNGIDSVKAVANYITTNCDDDGISYALKHYGLI